MKTENPIKLRDVKRAISSGTLSAPQCKECGYWNVGPMRKHHVDFYGCPVVWHCSCGWEEEILKIPE